MIFAIRMIYRDTKLETKHLEAEDHAQAEVFAGRWVAQHADWRVIGIEPFLLTIPEAQPEPVAAGESKKGKRIGA